MTAATKPTMVPIRVATTEPAGPVVPRQAVVLEAVGAMQGQVDRDPTQVMEDRALLEETDPAQSEERAVLAVLGVEVEAASRGIAERKTCTTARSVTAVADFPIPIAGEPGA